MDTLRLLEEAGGTPAADDAVIEAAVELVLAAAFVEGGSSTRPAPAASRGRWTRVAVGAAALVTAAAAVVAVAALLPGHAAPGRGSSPHGSPPLLTAAGVQLISSSTSAVTDSGTATEVLSSPATPGTNTIAVTFSGQDTNYLITGNSNGAEGVQNRVVDGQLYLYVKGPDLQMHWYHDTAPGASAALSFPDPRTLLHVVSPSARFEDLGHKHVDGLELTHLRATTPGAIGALHIADIGETITGLDVWVDAANVVEKMAVSSSIGSAAPLGSTGCPATPFGSGPRTPATNIPTEQPASHDEASPDVEPLPRRTSCTPTPLILDISFANLGTPQTITAPTGAIDEQLLG